MKKIIFTLVLGISIGSTLVFAGMPGDCFYTQAELLEYCDDHYGWSPVRHSHCMETYTVEDPQCQ